MYLCVLCLTVVPLPPGKSPFAAQLNNIKIKHSNTRPEGKAIPVTDRGGQ
jgi:hypothetical protein